MWHQLVILSRLNYQVEIISSFLLNTEFLWIVTTYMVVNLFKEWKFMIFNGNILFTLLIYNWTICTLTAFKSILTFGFKSMHFFFWIIMLNVWYIITRFQKGKMFVWIWIMLPMLNKIVVFQSFFFFKHHIIDD